VTYVGGRLANTVRTRFRSVKNGFHFFANPNALKCGIGRNVWPDAAIKRQIRGCSAYTERDRRSSWRAYGAVTET
jgi:hypothetical protein